MLREEEIQAAYEAGARRLSRSSGEPPGILRNTMPGKSGKGLRWKSRASVFPRSSAPPAGGGLCPRRQGVLSLQRADEYHPGQGGGG